MHFLVIFTYSFWCLTVLAQDMTTTTTTTESSRTPRSSTKGQSFYYSPSVFFWTFGLFGTLLVLCAVLSCLKYRATQARMTRRTNLPNYNRPYNAQRPGYTQSVNPSPYNPYNYDVNTIYNTNFQNDLPPPYETIKVEPKDSRKEEDVKETNV